MINKITKTNNNSSFTIRPKNLKYLNLYDRSYHTKNYFGYLKSTLIILLLTSTHLTMDS